MGEIGIQPDTFRFRLSWWEIRCIIRGYNRRYRHTWSAARWQTYNLMLAQCGSENMMKSGINGPADLLKLPWDEKPSLPSADEIAELQREMAELNRQKSI